VAKIKDDKKYVSFNNLIVRLFVIGGNGSGESIVVIFCDGEEVVFSMAIDSCETDFQGGKIILPQKVLQHYGVKKLDSVVWTHPHDDHSRGMEQIICDYYGKKTIGVLPKQLYTENNSVVKMSGLCRHILKVFNMNFSRKNLKSMDCQECDTRSLLKMPLYDIATGEEKTIELYCMTPIDYLLDDKLRKNRQFSNSLLNELSLTLILSFDDYYFYFGGDAPDKTILKSNLKDIERCRWIKIPHHSSETAKDMISIIDKNIDSAVSTTFFVNGLPKREILNQYNARTNNVYVTQKNVSDNLNYGMIEYEYKFGGPLIELQIKTYGNAYKYQNAGN